MRCRWSPAPHMQCRGNSDLKVSLSSRGAFLGRMAALHGLAMNCNVSTLQLWRKGKDRKKHLRVACLETPVDPDTV